MSEKAVKGVCTINGHTYAHASACEEYAGAKWERDDSQYSYLEEINCWEYTDCGFEEGGRNAATQGVCHAYPNHGRLCTALESTQCQLGHNSPKGGLALLGRRNCQQCGFFNNVLSATDLLPRHAVPLSPRQTEPSGCAATHQYRR